MTMTDPERGNDVSRLARKAVIARQLTDPLGRHGLRRTRARLEDEARARRLVFVTALTTFAAMLLATVGTASEPAAPTTSAIDIVGTVATSVASGNTTQSAPSQTSRQSVNRVVVPTPHKRTRSS